MEKLKPVDIATHLTYSKNPLNFPGVRMKTGKTREEDIDTFCEEVRPQRRMIAYVETGGRVAVVEAVVQHITPDNRYIHGLTISQEFNGNIEIKSDLRPVRS